MVTGPAPRMDTSLVWKLESITKRPSYTKHALFTAEKWKKEIIPKTFLWYRKTKQEKKIHFLPFLWLFQVEIGSLHFFSNTNICQWMNKVLHVMPEFRRFHVVFNDRGNISYYFSVFSITYFYKTYFTLNLAIILLFFQVFSHREDNIFYPVYIIFIVKITLSVIIIAAFISNTNIYKYGKTYL